MATKIEPKTPAKPQGNEAQKKQQPGKGDGGENTPKAQSNNQTESNQNNRRGAGRGEGRNNERGGFRGGRGGPGRGGGGRGRGGHDGSGRFNRQENQGFQQGHQQSGYQIPDNVPLEDVIPKEEKKFTGRCRLFVGNITQDMTEQEFKDMFTPFGEISEVFLNGSKGFAFIRLDYRRNAEAAKNALDGTSRKGRILRVRFANHGASVKVKNLSPFVSNELLYKTFSQFGEVERAVVFVDDKSRSLGEGVVEFARKPGSSACLKRITEGVLLMSSYPRPLFVEPLEQKDEVDGLPEKFLPKNDYFRKDREKEPRFAAPGSFEYRFALKWKELDECEKQKIEMVKAEMEEQRRKLDAEMESSMYEYQAEQLRADLLRQQEELQRLEELGMRRRQEMNSRRQEESMMMREEEDRRREMMMNMRGGVDSSMMGGVDAGMRGSDPGARGGQHMDRGGQQRHDSPSRQGGMRDSQRGRPGGPPPIPPPPAPPVAMGIENESGFGGGQMSGGSSGGGSGSMRQSRFDQQGQAGYGGNGSFSSRGGNMGGQGVPGSGGMYNGGGMGGRQGGMGDRRREAPGGPRDEYDDMKRMRRY